MPGPADDGGARIRSLPGGDRPAHRGPAAGAGPHPSPLAAAVHLQRRRRAGADGRGAPVGPAAAAGRDLRDADRAAGHHRPADRRGAAPRPRRHRRHRRRAARPPFEVRQVPAGAAAAEHASTRSSATSTAAASSTRTPRPNSLFVSLRGTRRHLRVRLADVPDALRPRPASAPSAAVTPTAARLQPLLRRSHAARLVSRRGRRPGPAAVAVDLPRPPRAALHLPLPLRGAGAPRPRRPAVEHAQAVRP